jgi:hypothetical protein
VGTVKLRIGEELFQALGAASSKFAMEKCEIIRRAIRKFRRVRPVVPATKVESTTYGGHVMDVALWGDVEDATSVEIRRALDWYLEIHKDAPATTKIVPPLTAGLDYILVDEEEE